MIANKQNQLPNGLTTFLHSPLNLALLGFVVWFIDKLFNVANLLKK